MTKNGLIGYIILAIILLVFSMIAFVVPLSMTVSFWIAYIFGVVAIAYQVYVFKISFSKGDDVKSRFYGFPIAKLGVVYLFVQLILSLIEMCLAAFIPAWVVIIINIIPIAVVLIGCIAADAMRDEIVRQDVQLKKNVSKMRTLQSLSASLVRQYPDETLEIELKRLEEEFKFSDPVSSDSTKEIENDLDIQMKELQKVIIDGDFESAKVFCDKLIVGLSERNRICALNK